MRELRIRYRAALVARLAAAGVMSLLRPESAFAFAQNGSEFQVNTYTTGPQYRPSVASDSAGNFVVVWQSYGSPGSDNFGWSVQGQRYGASGSAIGVQFQVNTYTTGDQRLPSVASDSAGNFVVTWQSYGSTGTDKSPDSIQGQRYNASGSPIGGEFQVNTYTTNSQYAASVASDSNGNFVVVWESIGSPGNDTSMTSIQGQRFAAGGSAIGGEFQINTYTTSYQHRPSVASDSSGNFVVVWHSFGSAGSDTSFFSVQGQRYAANGAAIGGQFQVNTFTPQDQSNSSVASDSAGNFVVVWESDGSPGSDTSGRSVQGQRYNAGSAIGAQFQVNTYTTNNQRFPTVARDSTGDFAVVWESLGSAGSDTSSYSVQGQLYDAGGAAIGGEFQVNTYTTNGQYTPSLASDSAGKNFVVVWYSKPSAASPLTSIQAQRYLPEPSIVPSLGALLAIVIALARRR